MARVPRMRVVGPDDGAPPTPRTLDELFRVYARYVGSIGLKLLGRPHEIEDFVQDVFLRAHRGLADVENPAAIKGWLAKIAVHLALRRLKRRRLLTFIGLDDGFNYLEVVSPALSPEDRALLGELYRRLDALPARERLAWSLRHIEGERLEDVARLCECSLATAKRRIAAAQARLQPEADDE